MAALEIDLSGDAQFTQELSHPVRITEAQRTHGKGVSPSFEDMARPSNVRIFFQQQDLLALLGEFGGAGQASHSSADDNDIVFHGVEPADMRV